jgi:hypothetical protein
MKSFEKAKAKYFKTLDFIKFQRANLYIIHDDALNELERDIEDEYRDEYEEYEEDKEKDDDDYTGSSPSLIDRLKDRIKKMFVKPETVNAKT